jgi:hypothetical protein
MLYKIAFKMGFSKNILSFNALSVFTSIGTRLITKNIPGQKIKLPTLTQKSGTYFNSKSPSCKYRVAK